MPAGTLPGFPDGMVMGQHGSWNRSTLSGYRVVFVPFPDGKSAGEARVILSGCPSPDETYSHGRPVGVAIRDGALRAADDPGKVIWRVTAARGRGTVAGPSRVTPHMQRISSDFLQSVRTPERLVRPFLILGLLNCGPPGRHRGSGRPEA